jgi:hypothetical protein
VCDHKFDNGSIYSIQCDEGLCQNVASIISSRHNHFQTLEYNSPTCGTAEDDLENTQYKYLLMSCFNYKMKYLELKERFVTFNSYYNPSDVGYWMFRRICDEDNCNNSHKMNGMLDNIKIDNLM